MGARRTRLKGLKRQFVDYGKRPGAVLGMLLLALMQMGLRMGRLAVWGMAE